MATVAQEGRVRLSSVRTAGALVFCSSVIVALSPVVVSASGVPFCSPSRGLQVRSHFPGAESSQVLYRLVFVNRGSATCKLSGVPGAMAYVGNRVPVGPPARRTAMSGAGGTVLLRARSGYAIATYSIGEPDLWPAGCDPAHVSGVLVRPLGVQTIFVNLSFKKAKPPDVCRHGRNTFVFGFSRSI